jgi:hypothetical protein
MSAPLLLRWRKPEPPIVMRWRGPAGVLDAIATRPPAMPLTAFAVPSAAVPEPEDILSFISSLDGALS